MRPAHSDNSDLILQLLNSAGDIDAAKVDALYGLEPILESASSAAELQEDVDVLCPHCGEHYDSRIDLTAGATQQLIEDCAICCRPLQIDVWINSRGALRRYRVHRLDGSDD